MLAADIVGYIAAAKNASARNSIRSPYKLWSSAVR
jgi:hypothetical protein